MGKSDILSLQLPDPNQLSGFSSWQLDFRQIETGAMETRVNVRRGSLLTLLDIRMSRAVHQTGAAPADEVTFGLPLSPSLAQWLGVDLGPSPLLAFGSGAEFSGLSRPGFHGLTIGLAKDQFADLASRNRMEVPDHVVSAGVFSVHRQAATLAALAGFSRGFLSPAAPSMDRSDEEEIATGLLLALSDGEAQEDKSSPKGRARALARALEYMEQHADENRPISEICVLAGTSWRTLDRAFKLRFAVGPKTYYRNLRLTRARLDLLSRGPEVAVADVANRWGFWHMGQFARDYRRLFGQLPSSRGR
jgi:AraC-like DNA-binding protein